MIKMYNLDPEVRSMVMGLYGPRRQLHVCKVDAGNVAYLYDNVPSGRLFHTIAKAIASSEAYDDILVWPGTYAESIVLATFNNRRLLGVGYGSAIVAPTDSHALLIGVDGTASAVMIDSLISNITFLTPSTSNPTYAAVTIAYMIRSVIEDCKFRGTTDTGFDPTHTIGLQIGNRSDTPWEFSEHCRISRNEFTSNGGRTTELGRGIQVGASITANPEYKGFKSMIIEDNIISAYDTGIYLQTGNSSCGGTIIRRNVITSQQGGVGSNVGIISRSTDGVDTLCMILDNRIAAVSDAISNFRSSNVQANIVSVGGGAPASETGQ